MMIKSALALLAPAMALLLSGCGEEVSTPSEARTPSAEPTATNASPSMKNEASLKAVDGTNLRECSDRTCEVQIEPGDTIRFAKRFDARKIVVKGVSGKRLHLVGYGETPSPSSWTIAGNVTIHFGDVSLESLRIEGHRAVIRIRPQS